MYIHVEILYSSISYFFKYVSSGQVNKWYVTFYIHSTLENLHLHEYLAEAFQCYVHYYQGLVELVELVFQFIRVEIAEVLVWLACAIMSKNV